MISKHTIIFSFYPGFLEPTVKEGLSRSFHYTLLLVPVVYIQYAFGNAGCVKYRTGTRLLLMRLVFETDQYWPDNVQYSLIKIGDRKEIPVIVNIRFLPQCFCSFTERLKFYVSLIFLSMQVDGALYRDSGRNPLATLLLKALYRYRIIYVLYYCEIQLNLTFTISACNVSSSCSCATKEKNPLINYHQKH